MTPIALTVGADGRVRIPGTSAGQKIAIYIRPEPGTIERAPSPESPEEWERIKQEILEGGRRVRADATPEEIERAVNHGDWLYGPDGLPRRSSTSL